MDHVVDARGQECPQPVINTKKVLENLQEEDSVTAIVDNEDARDNIARLARKSECHYEIEERKGDYFIKIARDDCLVMGLKTKSLHAVLLTSDKVGSGDETLGQTLMKSFLYSLSQLDVQPERVILMNSGVKLGLEDSDFLKYLIDLENQGMEIIACGTCLDYYNSKNKLCVGRIGNMYEIVEYLFAADKTISL